MKKFFIALGIAFALICAAIVPSVSARIDEYKQNQTIKEHVVASLQERWDITEDDVDNVEIEYGYPTATGEYEYHVTYDLYGYSCYSRYSASELGIDC